MVGTVGVMVDVIMLGMVMVLERGKPTLSAELPGWAGRA